MVVTTPTRGTLPPPPPPAPPAPAVVPSGDASPAAASSTAPSVVPSGDAPPAAAASSTAPSVVPTVDTPSTVAPSTAPPAVTAPSLVPSTDVAAASTASPPPVKPTMGGLLNVGGYYVAWTGGEPNVEWTGLADPSATCVNPTQTRSNNPKAAPSYAARQAGLYPSNRRDRFKRGDDLDRFIQKLYEALLDFGMDSICYRKDALNPKAMVNALLFYPRLNRKTLSEQSTWFETQYDSYDKSNDIQARRFFLASISDDLQELVENKASPQDLFIDYLFIFIEELRPLTYDTIQSQVEAVLNMRPSDFPGESISMFVANIQPKLKQLSNGHMWDPLNNVALARTLACAGSGNNGNSEYSSRLWLMVRDLDDECGAISHLPNQQKNIHMSKKNLGWEDILRLADTCYKSQMTPGRIRWPPACHASDSKAPPSNFGSANLGLTQVRPNGNSNGSSAWKKKKSSPTKQHGNGSKGNHSGSGSGSGSKNPKYVPPSKNATPTGHVNGSPIFEKTINGIKFNWCAKCKRWSTTHSTGTHTGKSGNNSGRNNPDRSSGQTQGNFGLVPDPSLWLACLEVPPPIDPVRIRGGGPPAFPAFQRGSLRRHVPFSDDFLHGRPLPPLPSMSDLDFSDTESGDTDPTDPAFDVDYLQPAGAKLFYATFLGEESVPKEVSVPTESVPAENPRPKRQIRKPECLTYDVLGGKDPAPKRHRRSPGKHVHMYFSEDESSLEEASPPRGKNFEQLHARYNSNNNNSPVVSYLSVPDPALSPNPTWSSVFVDIGTLLGPHLACVLLFSSIYSLLMNGDTVLLGLRSALSGLIQVFQWFDTTLHWCSLRLSGHSMVHQFGLLLWLLLFVSLVLATLYGRPILDYYCSAPPATPTCTAPTPCRKYRRHCKLTNRRCRRRYQRHRTKLACEAYKVQNRRLDYLFQPSLSGAPFTLAQRLKEERASGWASGWAAGYQSGSKRHPSATNCGRRRQTQPRRRNFHKPRSYQRRCTPYHLDLSDPIFRKGLGHANRYKFNQALTASAEDIVLQFPLACKAAMHPNDTFSVVWDSGASMCVSSDRRDFVGPIKPLQKEAYITGIGSKLKIQGQGTVIWSMMDTDGKLRHLKLPCYYVPQIPQRLLSTSVFTNTYPDNTIKMSKSRYCVTTDCDKGNIDVFINPYNNLPTSTCFRHQALCTVAANFNEAVSATHVTNHNLSEPQKELLRWHQRLGHVGFRTIQFLMKSGVLASSAAMRRLHTAASRIPVHELPKCAACQFGRQTNRAKPGTISRIVMERSGILSADQGQPGQRVFLDHFVCSTRGRKIKGYGIRDPSGKSPTRSDDHSYCGGCIFVDASSGYVAVRFQSYLNSKETIESVADFEREARDSGIIISGYSADNGAAFSSAAIKTYLARQGQIMRYAGAGSHHQNGKAERAIRTIMAMARTMLLHAAVHWPSQADPSLWPLAVRHAVWIYNHIPKLTTGLCPADIWTKSRFAQRKFHHVHVFGCPVYVLQKRLADGKSIGRWEPRSTRCVNLGFSDHHSKDTPYVLNPSTGSITPQWNVTFDDWFTTVLATEEELPDFNADEWSTIFGTTTSHFEPEDQEENPDDEATPPAPTPSMVQSQSIADNQPSAPLPVSTVQPSFRVNPTPERFSSPSGTSFPSTASSPDIWAYQRNPPTPPTPVPSSQPSQEENAPLTPLPVSKSTIDKPETTSTMKTPSPISVAKPSPVKSRMTPARKVPAKSPMTRLSAEMKRLGISTAPPSSNAPRPKRHIKKPESLTYDVLGGTSFASAPSEDFANYCKLYYTTYGITYDPQATLHAFAPTLAAITAKKKNPDILSYDEAMRDFENLDKWLDAAKKEITQLEEKQCWEQCLKSEANGEPIIPCTWVFRYKRNPAGDITKCKGRICLRGDLMEDDEESYAPVCNWSSVRFFLIFAIIMRWVTISVDWNNAFIQAVLKKPMYMATPRGFRNKFGSDGCLRVLRSLYGSKFAPRNWYTHLRSALLSDTIGMKESAIDPCLLYRKDIIMVLYVDDAGIAAANKSTILEFVQQLKDLGFDLDIEDDFNSYLGIGIEEFDDGSRHMTQKGLIKKLLKTTDMEDCNPNWTPTTQVALGSDPEGEPYDQKQFSYASVVGMLLYLSNNTRPDITFAVSQVARFTAAPKKSHATAVKTIIRYLARTPDKGIIVKPDGTFNIRTWVDADFSGLHGREDESNPASAKSRYGYIITFSGVPLVWKSQLISEICLSTLHAEYVGLVSAVRAIIPLRSMISEVLGFLDLPTSKPEIHCTIFEDNQGAYLLATNQRITPRTKYFNVKYHFFWSYVYNEDTNPGGWLVIIKCPTDKMNADYLTKGLGRHIFDANRLRVQGF